MQQDLIKKTKLDTVELQLAVEVENVEAAGSNSIESLEIELKWLEKVIIERTSSLLKKSYEKELDLQFDLPNNGEYAELLRKYNFGIAERLTLILAIASNLKPELFDYFLEGNPDTGKIYREYGGLINAKTISFQPTLRTALFLLSGNDMKKFVEYQNVLRSQNRLFTEQIVNLYSTHEHQNYLPDCLIQLDSAYIDYLYSGDIPRLDSGNNFPANLLETDKTFDDLILEDSVKAKLKPALNYVRVQQELYADSSVGKKIKKGFVLLLHGPPGTGKTFTASIIGNELNTQVYQIDSSLVVSKYIGETEKNLESVFQRLEGKNCILFFDEADSLFGKRTEIVDSKDRYANQGVSYLLQRLETFDGLVIMATNFEKNFDEAFKRRILTKIHIGRPGVAERELLWKNALPSDYSYSSDQLVEALAEHFDFTGANISVVVKMSVEQAFTDKIKIITSSVMAPFLGIIGREISGLDFRKLPYKE